MKEVQVRNKNKNHNSMSQNKAQHNNSFFKKHWKTLLIFVLLITNVVTVAVYKPKAESKVDPSINYRATYPYLDPIRRIEKRENLIVNIQEVREFLKALPAQNKDWADMSIYFEVLGTGASVTINQDLQIWPASLAKLPLSMVVMKRVESGQWTLQTKIKMDPSDADSVGTPGIEREIGREYDVKFLIERLLLESDNTAYRMLLKNFTDGDLNSISDSVGLEALFTDNGKISAKDYTRLLRSLYLATYINEENSQFILKQLAESKFEHLLRAGIPKDVKFAHKWGTNIAINVYADSGIVYVPEKPYMVSVMVQAKNGSADLNDNRANELMKSISEKIYSYMSDAKN